MARSKKWWDTFWNKNQDYGLPNETLMKYAADYHSKKSRKNGLTAVDIASGNGRYAIALAKEGYNVDAFELSDTGVARIKKDAKKEKVLLNAEQVDFLKICSKKKQYDLVFCSGLLEEIDKKNHEKAIEGFMRWTKPSGINIIKYCLEIGERGRLVDENFVPKAYKKAKWKIVFLKEKKKMHASRAKIKFNKGYDASIRTGTIVASKPQ